MTSPGSDLTTLLAAAHAQDPHAWTTIVDRYSTLVERVARRHRLSDDETDDVVQETWLRLLQNLESIRDPERLPGWLATTASRESVTARRRRQREGVALADLDERHQDPDGDDRMLAERRSAALVRAVAALPRRERQLVEALLEPAPLSYAQISRRLSMPVGSIGPIRARALRRLRAVLVEEPAAEPAARSA